MMSTGAIIAAVVGAAMALTLSWQSLRSRQFGSAKILRMALIWVAVFAVLTLIISQVKL